MKIAFLGLKQAFDYFQIGGTETFVRRFATQILHQGIHVDYILYGNKRNKELTPMSGLNLRYFKLFQDALDVVEEQYDHILTIYLLPRHRVKYALFRRKNDNSLPFHFIYFGWPCSLIRRKLYFSEARVFPYNGKLFCISKRQYEYLTTWAKNVTYLLPPVFENCFLNPKDKPINNKIKLTYLGRIDLDKGIKEVITVFNALKNCDKFECCICAIPQPAEKRSLQINNWLRKQEDIKYIEIDKEKYTIEVERIANNILRQTDILLLPYKRLSSTIDTPVTLLEAMASMCVVITKPLGNIQDIYGESKFIVPDNDFLSRVMALLETVSIKEITRERQRIHEQNLKLNLKRQNLTDSFLRNSKSHKWGQ